MNHTITVGGLLSVLSIIGGLGVLGFCVLMLLASMMSDGTSGDGPLPAANYLIPIGGAVLIALGIWGLA